MKPKYRLERIAKTSARSQVESLTIAWFDEVWTKHTLRFSTIVVALSGLLVSSMSTIIAGCTTAGYVAAVLRTIYMRRVHRDRRNDNAKARTAIDQLASELRARTVHPQVWEETIGSIRGADPTCRRIKQRLAAVAHITHQVGAPAADLLRRLSDDERSRARIRRVLDAQTAGITASVRLLIALPAVGILLGEAIGADPMRILFTTDAGAICLGIAAFLQVAGVSWSRKLAQRAQNLIEGTSP